MQKSPIRKLNRKVKPNKVPGRFSSAYFKLNVDSYALEFYIQCVSCIMQYIICKIFNNYIKEELFRSCDNLNPHRKRSLWLIMKGGENMNTLSGLLLLENVRLRE
jgi:hypothetical protein